MCFFAFKTQEKRAIKYLLSKAEIANAQAFRWFSKSMEHNKKKGKFCAY